MSINQGQDTNSSLFAVTCVRAWFMHGRNVGFGQLLTGFGVVREAQAAPLGEEGQVGWRGRAGHAVLPL